MDLHSYPSTVNVLRIGTIQIGDKFYRQIVGIPQGSVLSTILCSFFYGDMEGKLSQYVNDPQGVRCLSLSYFFDANHLG
jgi:hypothetical protein